MRRVKWIATKDHVVLSAKTYFANDEVHSTAARSGHNLASANAILYWTSGNTRVFTSNTSHNIWNVHADVQSSFGAVRPLCGSGEQYTNGFGMVNLNDSNSAYTAIIPKSLHNTGNWKEINAATKEEHEYIDEHPTQTVIIKDQCYVGTKRNPETFDIYNDEPENDISVDDLNIDWE